MTAPLPASDPAALDAADPLAAHRDDFVGAETPLVYFDGNSLGRPLRSVSARLVELVERSWGGRLIRGWDEEWWTLPTEVGDTIGRVCLGAAPGQVVVGDSTTVLLYKLLRAAVAARPDRREVVLDRGDFPTDRYVAQGVAEECGLELRWVESPPDAGVTPELLAEAVGERTAVVLLSHVAYRSAWLADMEAITRVAHDAGALVLWDLSHSVGVVPIELDGSGVDLAVGCGYKYLNGGPGAPAFCYVSRRLQDSLTQPVRGWVGSADPFAMGPAWEPAAGVRRFLSGTPPVVGMVAMREMLALLEEVGIAAVREKSVALTQAAVGWAEELLTPYAVRLASPRDPGRRGSHVTLDHPAMREVTAALWRQDVIPDFRAPSGLRIGLSPLSTSFTELRDGLEHVRSVLDRVAG